MTDPRVRRAAGGYCMSRWTGWTRF